MRCPICREAAGSRSENATFPFCSERCRLIDLGNWLGESYRVPDVDEVDEVDDEEPAKAGEDDDREAATPGASSPSARRDKRTS